MALRAGARRAIIAAMRVALLGLGLIGGSIARALAADRESGATHRVTAWTPSGEGPRRALAAGVIDSRADDPAAAIAGADLVVLACPPLACVDLLRRLGSDLRASLEPGATVTDVASTKGVLAATARAAGVPYVGGHPMAGRETSGFEAADAGLFRDRPWVIVEPVAGGDPALVRAAGAGLRRPAGRARRGDPRPARGGHQPPAADHVRGARRGGGRHGGGDGRGLARGGARWRPPGGATPRAWRAAT